MFRHENKSSSQHVLQIFARKHIEFKLVWAQQGSDIEIKTRAALTVQRNRDSSINFANCCSRDCNCHPAKIFSNTHRRGMEGRLSFCYFLLAWRHLRCCMRSFK